MLQHELLQITLMRKGDLDSIWPMFGAWIKEKRESLKPRVSQNAIAKKVGIDRQQYYRIESGKSGTRRETVLAIADALSLDKAEALNRAGFSATVPDKPKNATEFIAALEALGVESIQWSDWPNGLQELTEDDFDRMLDQVRSAVEVTLNVIKRDKRKNKL